MNRRVYFDHYSATPVLPEVFEAMRPYFMEQFGSPSSLHQLGLRAREALAQARQQAAQLIHAASPEEMIFTSGGTESANLAIKGVAFASHRRGNHIVLTETEHPAVTNSVEFLEKNGFTSTRVKVDGEGRVKAAEVAAAMTDQTMLVCVHHANHDIGTIQPIAEIGALVGERGIPLFVDATASGGWLPIDVEAMGIQLLSLAPHRFYGPKGAGLLYRHRRARLAGIQHGGTQENGRRAGTENVPAIVGAGVACAAAARDLGEGMARTARLQQQLWSGLEQRIEYIRLNGPPPGPLRLSTNLNFSTEFIEGESQALRCDVKGIAVASGTSCAVKSLKISPTLSALGIDPSLAQSNLILTLGKDNTEEEVNFFIETFAGIVAELRGMSPTWDEFQRGLIDSAVRPRNRAEPGAGESQML